MKMPPLRSLPILLFAISAIAASAATEPPPELTRDDARRILEAQDWSEITVIAVINGVSRDKVASPSLAHVLALARRDGKWQDLKFDVFYDRTLGWFTYENFPDYFRVWNREGYHEIKPRIGL